MIVNGLSCTIKLLVMLGYALFFCFHTAFAQCPDSKFLQKKIDHFRKATTSVDEQLKELKFYDSLAGLCEKRDSTHETLKRMIGAKYYMKRDFAKAIDYYRQANRIIEENASRSYIKPHQLITNYYWISVFYDSLGNRPEQIAAIDTCISQAMRMDAPPDFGFIRAISDRIEYFFDAGDYYKTLEYARECANLCAEYISNDTTRKDSASMNLARYILAYSEAWYVKVRLMQKQYTELETYLLDKANVYRKSRFRQYLAYVYASLSELYVSKGEQHKAIKYFDSAHYAYQQIKSRLSCKQMWNTLGTDLYFRQLKNDDKALSCYRTALSYKIPSNDYDAVETLNIYCNMGNVYVQKRNFDSAFYYFDLAFRQISHGADETYVVYALGREKVKYKKVHLLASLIIDKGNAYLERYRASNNKSDLKQAVRIYKLADRFLDIVKAEQSDLESKLFWRNGSRRLYERAIEATYMEGNMDDAFYFFEKSRAVLLQDQLKLQGGLAMHDIARLGALRKEIGRLNREQATATTDSERVEAGHQLFVVTQELDDLEKAIKKINPVLYQSMIDTSFMSLDQVQQALLKQGQSLVEIFRGDSAVYVLLIMKNTVYLNKTGRAEFDSRAASFIMNISDKSLINRNYRSFVENAQQLYQLIFQEVNIPAGRIIISPDGQYFPFEALVVNKDLSSPRYFIRDYAVSYTYSARFLQNSFHGSNKSGYGFLLGVAPVEYANELNLSPLRGSEESLTKIRSDFRTFHSLVGRQASRDNFLQQFSNYAVIQLYTHASGTSKNNEPVIYFADAPLYLSELIPESQPATRLIVLSGCETGLGKVYEGEGVFSFNRAFAALGIPSSVSNLWQVDSKPTYRITELFHKHLANGLPLDEALQKAKLEYLDSEPSEQTLPYYWAASILVGKTDAIAEKKPTSVWTWILLIIGLPLVGLLAYWLIGRGNQLRDSQAHT